MGFISRLFGGQKAVDEVIKASIKGIDSAFYTREEQSKDAMAARAKLNDQVVEFVKSTTGFELARRTLAFMIVGIWCLCLLFLLVCGIADGFGSSDNWTKAAANVNSVMDGWAVHAIVILVITFYFKLPNTDGTLIQSIMSMKKQK